MRVLMKDSSVPPLQAPQPGGNAEDSDEDDGAGRGFHAAAARRGRKDRVGELLSLRDDEVIKHIPMSEIMKSADAQHNAVLRKPWYVREDSNRERVLAKFILDMTTPARCCCKDFDLLPEQRVAILAMTNPMPVRPTPTARFRERPCNSSRRTRAASSHST